MSSPGKGRPSLRELIVLGLLAAMMIGTKVAMAALPNIHLGAVFLSFAVMLFGWKALYTAIIYIVLEGMIYGFGIWWVSYIYCWPLLVCMLMLVRRQDSALLYAILSGLFGLAFGALCEIPYLFLIGWKASVAMWIAGIPYDLLHGGGNFVLCLLLLPTLKKLRPRLLASLKKA